jgi:hypothetical protein
MIGFMSEEKIGGDQFNEQHARSAISVLIPAYKVRQKVIWSMGHAEAG